MSKLLIQNKNIARNQKCIAQKQDFPFCTEKSKDFGYLIKGSKWSRTLTFTAFALAKCSGLQLLLNLARAAGGVTNAYKKAQRARLCQILCYCGLWCSVLKQN